MPEAAGVNKTGACYDGFHETSFSADGMSPPIICTGIVRLSVGSAGKEFMCACDCHKKITELYEMTGQPRIWPTSQFSSQRREMQADKWRSWGLDEILEGVESRRALKLKLPEDAEEPAEIVTITEAIESGASTDIAAQLPPHPKRAEPKLDSQRSGRAPGQLEFEVKVACDQFAIGLVSGDPRGGIGALAIARLVDPQKPPSTGAVTNILMAWREIGFATIDEGPWRFMGYTRAGVQYGITPLREKWEAERAAARRTQQRQAASAKRNDEQSMKRVRDREAAEKARKNAQRTK